MAIQLGAPVAGACTPAPRKLISRYLPSSLHEQKQKQESYHHHHNLTTTTGAAVLVPQPMPPSPSAPSQWSPRHPTRWESWVTTTHYHLDSRHLQSGELLPLSTTPHGTPHKHWHWEKEGQSGVPSKHMLHTALCLALLDPFPLFFIFVFFFFLVKKTANKKGITLSLQWGDTILH